MEPLHDQHSYDNFVSSLLKMLGGRIRNYHFCEDFRLVDFSQEIL